LPTSPPLFGPRLGLATATLVGAAIDVGADVAVGDGLGLELGDGPGVGLGDAVGFGVGGTVGAAVGGGVGCGVAGGGEVGRAVAGGGVGEGGAVAAWTVIVPCIVVWIEQWYWNVPATVNDLAELLVPGAIGPVSNTPAVSDVAVCVVLSTRFCHVTVSPAVIVSGVGVKAKPWIATVRLAASAAAASATASTSTKTTTRIAEFRAIR
jgi:hypothetical protein